MNWIRRTEQSMDRASALASMVLPTPGTSSMSRCPSASRTISASLTASAFPSMTDSTAVPICCAVATRSSSVPLLAAPRVEYQKALLEKARPGRLSRRSRRLLVVY